MARETITFGHFVKEMRQLRGTERGRKFTSAELSEAIGVNGTPPAIISRIEKDIQYLGKQTYEKLGEALGFTLAEDGPYADLPGLNRARTHLNNKTKSSPDTFGTFIAQLRADRGYLTQDDLASALGVTSNYITQIETNKLGQSKKVVNKLADLLGFTFENTEILSRVRQVDPEKLTTFAASLRERRERLGISQSEFGVLLGYRGLNPSTMVSLFERGHKLPTEPILRKINEILGPIDTGLVKGRR